MKTMINKEMVANLKKDFDFETLVQLNGLIEDYKDLAEEYNEKIEFDYEMQVFDDSLSVAVKERCGELINTEKQVRELLENDDNELDIKFSDEAEKLVRELVQNFNGRTIEFDVLRASDRITKQILDLKSFKNSIEVIETAQRCLKNRTVDEETADRLIFINYLSIWNVLNMINEKDWEDIEDFEILYEEDIEVKEYLLDYIKCNQENGLETDADLVEFICSCGFDDNENRLSDCFYLN
ncbi:hypothetical protein FDB15_04020 [Clostridium botulinum]|uniref:hypothetical protein n=1 Tax=unclassified Clostridium TaxID=2614128 RepID=UPI0013CAD6A8|nr:MULTISPECIES: hypothetical protein [unclassified Clostridium]NFH99485.1 hypothetical protein [Clostridium botulinum]NFI62180.1 hypothetical protein [Clostridium botulinum]NFJ42614.1 hypothetical protein [Clostridium botulinum]NFJ46515.1 hypothetical protein [Clostridium botulinum]NFK26443.1 hypothetical protein [Clostridium botulinum]